VSDNDESVTITGAALRELRTMVRDQYETWALPGDRPELDELARQCGVQP
jgi:hypothetical protein